jgi:hypothetical protein
MSATAQRRPRVVTPEAEIERPAGSALMAALLAVQAQAPKLVRDATGQIQNRSYRYVTLDALLDVVLPILLEHELVWVTLPTRDDHGQPALRYRLTHTPSGDALEDTMPLMCATSDPQGQGSAITYARRYALMAVLNLAPDGDDDGAAASATSQVTSQAARPVKPHPDRLASAAQRGMLEKKARAAGLTTGDFANAVLVATGDPPRAWHDSDHADRTLKQDLERLPAKLVDAVITAIGAAHAAAVGGAS